MLPPPPFSDPNPLERTSKEPNIPIPVPQCCRIFTDQMMSSARLLLTSARNYIEQFLPPCCPGKVWWKNWFTTTAYRSARKQCDNTNRPPCKRQSFAHSCRAALQELNRCLGVSNRFISFAWSNEPAAPIFLFMVAASHDGWASA